MKKYLLILLVTVLLPFELMAFSLVGDPIKIPNKKQYIIYSPKIKNESLPNTKNATLDTTLLIYNIQTQATKATEMFYIKDNQLLSFDNSVWAIPVSKMLTAAVFEYLLNNDVVDNLAFQDINILQDFTLSGTTPYGPIINLDNKHFSFYITFYLKNEKTNKTQIKTIKYRQTLDSNTVSPDTYAKLTNQALDQILKELQPWLVKNIKIQKEKNKKIPQTDGFWGLKN